MKNINLNKVKDLKKLQETFNRTVEDKINKATINECINELNSLSLGSLMFVNDKLIGSLCESSKGKKCIANYVKTIKENKDLLNISRTHLNIANANGIDDATLFIKESIEFAKKSTGNNFNNGLNKLRKCISESIHNSNINGEDLKNIIKESKECVGVKIDNLIKEDFSITNSVNYVNDLHSLTESISNSTTNNNIEETGSIDDLNSLTEGLQTWEKEVVNKLSLCELSNGSKKDLFEEYKAETISLIEENIEDADLETKSNMETMKIKLENKLYNEDTLLEDLFKFAELKTLL